MLIVSGQGTLATQISVRKYLKNEENYIERLDAREIRLREKRLPAQSNTNLKQADLQVSRKSQRWGGAYAAFVT